MKHKLNKIEIIWLSLSILLAVLCMILPGMLVSVQADNNKNTIHQASASYYSTQAHTAVRMTLYERMKLISGEWESNWAEADQQEMRNILDMPEEYMPVVQNGQEGNLELAGYCYMNYQSVLKHAESELIKYYEEGFYPVNPQSTYSNWYRPTVTLYQYSDAIFDSYVCYVWLVELEYYDGSMQHTILLDDTSGMILAAGIQGDGYSLDSVWMQGVSRIQTLSGALRDYYAATQPIRTILNITGTNSYQPQYELWNSAYGLTAGQISGFSGGAYKKQILISTTTDISSYGEAVEEVKNIVDNDKFIYSLQWTQQRCWFSLTPFTIRLEQEENE